MKILLDICAFWWVLLFASVISGRLEVHGVLELQVLIRRMWQGLFTSLDLFTLFLDTINIFWSEILLRNPTLTDNCSWFSWYQSFNNAVRRTDAFNATKFSIMNSIQMTEEGGRRGYLSAQWDFNMGSTRCYQWGAIIRLVALLVPDKSYLVSFWKKCQSKIKTI